MWIYIVSSFTRYKKIGVEARKSFESAVEKDGFVKLHKNLYVRDCATSSNAAMHKERVKRLIPQYACDISIIMVSDNQEDNSYHSFRKRCKRQPSNVKPSMVEFF